MICELISLSKADGRVDEIELGFIKAVANRMGINDNELAELINNPVPFDPPTKDGDRILQFHRLVLLMNVDRQITDPEMEHLRIAGIKLGLNPLSTDEVLRRMFEYPNNVIPPEELIKIFLKHHN